MKRIASMLLVSAVAGMAPTVLAPAAPAGAIVETTCDFDGDGKNDLAVGVPGEDGKGAVNVQYTKVSPLDKASIIMGVDLPAGAGYGAALACGDFNSNGIDDLAVGAPTTPEGGRVYVHFGKAGQGLVAGVGWQWFTQNTAGVPGESEKDDKFGHALEAGDFNADGRDDLAIGIPNDVNHNVDRALPVGSVVIVRGGLPAVGLDFAAPVQQLFGWSVVEDYEVERQHFGFSLSAGPFVPGYPADALAVGAPYTTIVNDDALDQDCEGWECGTGEHPGQYRAGRAYLFRGDYAGASPYLHVDQEYAAGWGDTSETDDVFAWSLTGADYDGDGFFDLAIGSPGEGLVEPDAAFVGMVHVVHGPIVGPPGVGDVITLFESTIGGANEPFDRFGWAVTSGDYDVDGRADLVVGAPFEDIETRTATVNDAGAVFVFFGSAATVLGDEGVIRYQGIADTPDVSEHNDWFGASLTTLPVMFGADDLIIGIPGEEGPGALPDAMIAGAMTIAVGWPNHGPATCSCFFFHQDTGAPYHVADSREVSWASPPVEMTFGESLEGDDWAPVGEMYGWSAAS